MSVKSESLSSVELPTCRALGNQVAELSVQLRDARAALGIALAERDRARDEADTIYQAVGDARRWVAEAKARLEKALEHNDRLAHQVIDLRDRVANAGRVNTDLQAALRAAEGERDRLGKEANRLYAETAAAASDPPGSNPASLAREIS